MCVSVNCKQPIKKTKILMMERRKKHIQLAKGEATCA